MREMQRIAIVCAMLGSLFIVAADAPVRADHRGPCDGDIGGAHGTPVLTSGVIVDVAGAFYIDFRAVADRDTLWSIWLYMEDNGVPYLQRGGGNTPAALEFAYCLLSAFPECGPWDHCYERWPPDAVLV